MRRFMMPAFVLLFCGIGVGGYYFLNSSTSRKEESPTAQLADVPTDKKKILYVNSYHSGYEWSDGVTEGILHELGITRTTEGELDNSKSPFELRIVEMDTKRNASEESMAQAGLRAKQVTTPTHLTTGTTTSASAWP